MMPRQSQKVKDLCMTLLLTLVTRRSSLECLVRAPDFALRKFQQMASFIGEHILFVEIRQTLLSLLNTTRVYYLRLVALRKHVQIVMSCRLVKESQEESDLEVGVAQTGCTTLHAPGWSRASDVTTLP